ncbi:hypothetical protein Y1Q_0017574 [Alligator mississippiensis]|uniref:Uncharacterized protein n=1 Tax=Alligator mississippiensis TaxID=8496 RepID=A0A151P2H8_ALLMI|nr:hypothetical protein Y1Q_0017574 [Alligator mississippiensis]
MGSIEACIELYGGKEAVTLRLLLGPLAGQPAGNLLSELPLLQALMDSTTANPDGADPRSSACPVEHLEPDRCQPGPWREFRVPPPRTPEERAMFSFLLNNTQLTKQQLRILGDEDQRLLGSAMGFKYQDKPKNE